MKKAIAIYTLFFIGALLDIYTTTTYMKWCYSVIGPICYYHEQNPLMQDVVYRIVNGDMLTYIGYLLANIVLALSLYFSYIRVSKYSNIKAKIAKTMIIMAIAIRWLPVINNILFIKNVVP